MRNKLPYIALLIAVATLLLVLLSWIVAAAMPEMHLRSLLSPEGIRWFFGHFCANLASPLLVWIVLGTIAYGCLRRCGIIPTLLYRHNRSYRERFALRAVVIEFILFAIIIGLLTLLPHAILLSVTGDLYPSSFSASIVPIICFMLIVFSITFGVLSGSFVSLSDVYHSLISGFSHAAPLYLFYVLIIQLYYAIKFVFIL